jgi:hypothetical protein
MAKRVRTNKIVNISLTPFHVRKLALMQERTGLAISGIIQRLIENHDLFQMDSGKEKK